MRVAPATSPLATFGLLAAALCLAFAVYLTVSGPNGPGQLTTPVGPGSIPHAFPAAD